MEGLIGSPRPSAHLKPTMGSGHAVPTWAGLAHPPIPGARVQPPSTPETYRQWGEGCGEEKWFHKRKPWCVIPDRQQDAGPENSSITTFLCVSNETWESVLLCAGLSEGRLARDLVGPSPRSPRNFRPGDYTGMWGRTGPSAEVFGYPPSIHFPHFFTVQSADGAEC